MANGSEQTRRPALLMSRGQSLWRSVAASSGRGFLLTVTSLSLLAVLFIFFFIGRDALPFFHLRGAREFFTSTRWYPSAEKPEFGCLAIFAGTGLVTLGSAVVAVPLGVLAAVCLSDLMTFRVRQWAKPVVEVLAAIPSVAYGFFALVVLAPMLQRGGGAVLSGVWLVLAGALALLAAFVAADFSTTRIEKGVVRSVLQLLVFLLLTAIFEWGIVGVAERLQALQVASGTNALNVSLILGVMALPTVVSVSEDALQAVGRELREGSYALGATRAETLCRTVIPAASSGICAAIILGLMRAVGETMVVWMASGNAAQIPSPWFNFLQPVRTLTATIAGDMGEADQTTGSERYHVLFAMGLSLLVFAFACNLISEWVVRRQRRTLRGE